MFNKSPHPSDIQQVPNPDDVEQVPYPSDIQQVPNPDDVEQVSYPSDIQQVPNPDDVEQVPYPNNVEPSSLQCGQESSVLGMKPLATVLLFQCRTSPHPNDVQEVPQS